MKRATIFGVVFASIVTPALAHEVRHHPITISCYRGPIHDVIWDKPNSVFIESLASYGYSSERAVAIATRICRNEALVGNEAALKAETIRLVRAEPPRRSH